LFVALQPRPECLFKHAADWKAAAGRATSLGFEGEGSSARSAEVPSTVFEVEPRKVLARRLTDGGKSLEASIERKISNLTGALADGYPPAITAELALAKHIEKIALTPEGVAYVASGTWNILA
jgi:hypothetical protein